MWQKHHIDNYCIETALVKDVGTKSKWAPGIIPSCCWGDPGQDGIRWSCGAPAVYRLKLKGGLIVEDGFDWLSCDRHYNDIKAEYKKLIEHNQVYEKYLEKHGFSSIEEAAAALEDDDSPLKGGYQIDS